LNGGSTSHLTQFRIDDDGNLVQAATSPIASSANGVAIVSGNAMSPSTSEAGPRERY